MEDNPGNLSQQGLSLGDTEPSRTQGLSGRDMFARAQQEHLQGHAQQAENIYRKILRVHPRHVPSLTLLGTAVFQQGRNEEAIALLRRAIEIKSDYAEAHNNLGCVLAVTERRGEAVAEFRRALEINSDYGDAWHNLAKELRRGGEAEQSIAAVRRAVQLKPQAAEVYNTLGCALSNLGKVDEALAAYEQALAVRCDNANANLNRALLLLKKGRYTEGWHGYRWRWKSDSTKTPRPRYDKPLWDGSDLAGRTILLHQEQGYGDSMQFARYVPLVARRGGHVVLECHPALMRLYRTLAGVGTIVQAGVSPPAFDLYCSVVSLPRIFQTTVRTIPNTVPYLRAMPGAAETWRSRIGPENQLRVGLVWAAKCKTETYRRRSIPVEHLAKLLDIPRVRFYSLQVGPHAGRLAGNNVADLAPHLKDFADTAGAMDQLDLVITVDTAAAHLAGAMGKDTWVLLSHSADWRWLMSRDDSPWYPTTRLFRQERPEDWAGVIERAGRALRERIAQ